MSLKVSAFSTIVIFVDNVKIVKVVTFSVIVGRLRIEMFCPKS